MSWSPLKWSLVIAWSSLGIAALAIAFVGQGTNALSDVGPHLFQLSPMNWRTPLTTFRMYAEMLAEGMVPISSCNKTIAERYIKRLIDYHNLVENVLAYARLERGDPRTRQVALRSMIY